MTPVALSFFCDVHRQALRQRCRYRRLHYMGGRKFPCSVQNEVGSFIPIKHPTQRFFYALATLLISAVCQPLYFVARLVRSVGRFSRNAGFVAPFSVLILNAVPSTSRAAQTVVANYGGSNLVVVDLTTGDRTVLSSSSVGTGTLFGSPVGLARESSGSILVGENRSPGKIFRIDAATAAEIAAAAQATGAFALGAGAKDSAVVITLAPGAYTVQVSGTTTGTPLVEIYELT